MSYADSATGITLNREAARPGGQVWNDLARAVFPKSVSEMIALSAHLYEKHGVYRQGLHSAVSYFVTSLEVRGLDDDISANERYDITKFLNSGSTILDYAPTIGAELLAYGTVFLTAHIPFERYITCPHCGGRYNLKQYFPSENLKFSVSAGDTGEPGFVGKCPAVDRGCPSGKKHQQVIFSRDDISDKPYPPSHKFPITPVLMPPQIMRLIWSPMTGKRVPVMDTWKYQELAAGVTDACPDILYDTRWDYIRSVCMQKPLIMDDTSMKCLYLDPSAPERPKYKGWGCPQHLSAFPYAAQLVLLDTYNEISAAEFSMPRRVISPPSAASSLRSPSSGGSGGMMELDFKNLQSPQDFKQRVQTMMRELRKDPSKVAVSPYALQYQILGAESSDMITSEMLEYAEDRLLRSMGIIPELYKGGLEARVATPSMFGYKLFEKKWKLPVKKISEGIDWLVDRYEERLEWPKLRTDLTSTALQNDPRITEQILLRNQAGLVSDTTANKVMNLDGDYEREMIEYEQELRQQKAEEQSYEEPKRQMQREMVEGTAAQKQMEQDEKDITGGQQGAGAAPGGGGPVSGGSGPGVPAAGPMPQGSGPDLGQETNIPALEGIPLPPGGVKSLQRIDHIKAIGRSVAEQILQFPLAQRQQVTEALKTELPELHTYVMSELDKLEQTAESMGRQAAREGVIDPTQQQNPAGR